MTLVSHRSRGVAAAAVALVVVGCSSAGGSPAQPATSPAPRAAPITKTVTDRDRGTTVTLHVKDRLKVVLASTYWTLHPSSNSTVLRSNGQPAVAPRLRGCVPGAGCGTVTQTFTAKAKGTAVVSASRTTCGEVLRCTGNQGAYKISVIVK